jgi:hypothetical protein
MMMPSTPPSRFVLPLPGFVLHRYTAVFLAGIHLYLSVGHLSNLLGGDVQWTDLWKGFGSLGGAYVFAALASRGFAQHESQLRSRGVADADQLLQLAPERAALEEVPSRGPAGAGHPGGLGGAR